MSPAQVMPSTQKPQKPLEIVRRALLDSAVRIATSQGLSQVTIPAVAAMSGISKSVFFQHFASKKALLDTVFQEQLDGLDAKLDELIQADPEPYGCFTRAYIEIVMEVVWEGHYDPRHALAILMLEKAELRALWADWYQARIQQHQATDGDEHLMLTRLTLDGIWLADVANIPTPNRGKLREHLLQATYQKKKL